MKIQSKHQLKLNDNHSQKRGIAGTIVFTLFDRDALVDALAVRAAKAAYFQRIGGDINYQPYTITE